MNFEKMPLSLSSVYRKTIRCSCESCRRMHNGSRTSFSRTTGLSSIFVCSAGRSSLTRRMRAHSDIPSFARIDGEETKTRWQWKVTYPIPPITGVVAVCLAGEVIHVVLIHSRTAKV
jgi:hypothetical protein